MDSIEELFGGPAPDGALIAYLIASMPTVSCDLRRVIAPNGRPGWVLEVTTGRGGFTVAPRDNETWEDALRREGLLQ